MENGLNGSSIPSPQPAPEGRGNRLWRLMLAPMPERYLGGISAGHDGMVTFSASSLAERGNCPGSPGVAGGFSAAPTTSYSGSCGQAERAALAPRMAGKM